LNISKQHWCRHTAELLLNQKIEQDVALQL